MYLKISYMENKPLNRIKVMLAERMVSNKDLAEMLGKDPATISKWVTNTSQPTLENLIEIARCLKCEINELVRMDDTVQIKTKL
jgi:DNA-binding Xre family transcriptional regulator